MYVVNDWSTPWCYNSFKIICILASLCPISLVKNEVKRHIINIMKNSIFFQTEALWIEFTFYIYYKLKNLIHYWKQFIETFQTVDVWRISYKMYLKLFEKWPSISLLLLDKWLTDVEIRIRKLKFISPIGPILSSEVKKTHYIPWTCYVALNTIDLYGLDHM